MPIKRIEKNFELHGKVIQVLHLERKNVARIYYKPGYLEFPITPDDEYRLDDDVVLSGKLLIEFIKQNTLEEK